MAKISLSKISSDELDRMLGSDTITPVSATNISEETNRSDTTEAVSKDTDRSAYQREFRKRDIKLYPWICDPKR